MTWPYLAFLCSVFLSADSPQILGRYRAASANTQAVNTNKDQLLRRARQSIAEAEHIRSNSGASELDQLLQKYNQALADFQAAGQLRDQASTLKDMGELLHLADKPKLSLDYYRQALRLVRPTGDRKLEVEILIGLGDANGFLGRNQSAVSFYLQARRLSRSFAHKFGEAAATAGLGEAYYNLSDNRAAEYLERALAMWHALGDNRGRAKALRYLGYIQTDFSNLPLALEYYDQALILYRSARDERGEAQTINAVALVHTILGERDLGAEHYDQAQNIFRKIGDRHGLATALNGKGNLYAELDPKLALDYHTQALSVSEQTDNLEDQIISHRFLGSTYRDLSNSFLTGEKGENQVAYYDRAIEHFQHSLRLIRTLGDRRIEAYCLQDVAGVYESKQETKRALAAYERSLQLSRHVKDLRGQALILNRIGEIHAKLNDRQKALSMFHVALTLTRRAQDHAGEAMALHNIARIKQAEGDFVAALKAIDRALIIVESLRGKVPGYNFRSSYSASIYRYYQLKIDLLMDQHKRKPGADFDLRALEQTEMARARGLVDMLNDSRTKIKTDIPAALLEEKNNLQQALNRKAEQQSGLLSGKHTEEQTVAIEREIRELAARYENLQAQIRKLNPHYASLMEPSPFSISEIQQRVLDNDSIILEYLLGDERSYLWMLSRTEALSYELPGRATIEGVARNLHSSLTASQPIPGESLEIREKRVAIANQQLPSQIANLSNILLEPVASRLGSKRLLIVPDGALQYIPFQILTVLTNNPNSVEASVPTDRRSLLEDHEIVYQPSASILMLLVDEAANRKSPGKSVAILADPVFESDDPRLGSRKQAKHEPTQESSGEFSRAVRDVGVSNDGLRVPRLLASRDEAKAIMSVVPRGSAFNASGFDASRATAMRSDLGNYRIVHFATHGLLNNEHPELSGIVLSLVDELGQPQDGFLRLHDIYNLKLPVDLVVLSACNTGLGRDVRGEGLVGLTRGFMYAGASSVVASLWKVDDEATAELMRHFYAAMLKEGLSPAAALRKAQIEMSKRKRWQSPYYWSGFIIQGQYLPTATVPNNNSSRLPLWGGLAALLLIAVFFARQRRRTSLV